ncbi:MAG TPA: S-methyl-5-thioribose-1-phosphate isomerase [Bacteroidales bacterium]|nr:S-methyl-5-thioribose-1-phosphate isomerase [Bacteroidales bacterium]
MLVNKKSYKSIWLDEADDTVVKVIDQQKLPFSFEIEDLKTVDDVCSVIQNMTIRGAPLLGAAAAFGMYLSTLELSSHSNVKDHLANAARYLVSTRPTAVNLSMAVKYMFDKISNENDLAKLTEKARSAALSFCENEIENCRNIGVNGLKIIESIRERKAGSTVNILTHCNAGWLACVDYGTVTAPIYLAAEKGYDIHVWVDETRPRNQGARLTTWELGQNNIPHTLISDNTGGHLMQHGMVDIVLVGCDRATIKGDVANKIGTYLKAVAAFDNNIPFYSVLPSTSIDFKISDGLREIAIEERDEEEVLFVNGLTDEGIKNVRICPEGTKAANYGFDVTPARLITGLITEEGICRADEVEIRRMFSGKI